MTPDKKPVPLSDLISLAGKKALVTGGAMGIGYAIAYRLGEAGATVTLADLNDEKGNLAARNLIDSGQKAFFVRCDVSLEEDAKNAVRTAIENMGGIDILVNNAGIFPATSPLEMTASEIEKVLSVNIKGMLYFTREASRWMVEQKRSGCIINIASVDALHPVRGGMTVYDASKGAVVSLTKSLAKDLASYGIRVNAIAPGGIFTEGALTLTNSSAVSGHNTLREFMSRVPLRKMGAADDIGRVALFLASELSGYMTGSLLVVDGGYLLS